MTEALRANMSVPAAQARARAVDMLGQVGIEDGTRRLRHYPHQLSGGMLQRVMIAAALLTQPQLLLADEPTTALDVTTQAEVMAILDDLHREFGLTMLFITHDLELAAAICDAPPSCTPARSWRSAARRCCTTIRCTRTRPRSRGRPRTSPRRRTGCGRSPADRCRRSRRRWTSARFAPRCPHAQDACLAGVPGLTEIGGGLSRCVRTQELRGKL